MAITYKDINQLTQKASPAGTEKIPVSDTQYVTIDQIAAKMLPVLSASDANKLLVVNGSGQIIAGFSFGSSNDTYTFSNLQVISKLIGYDCSDFSFIKPSDVNTTLQDALDDKQNKITVSSSEPTSSQGSNGDIWIVI